MKFWQELRRRRVFRLAGLYIVGAWVVIQVADISFPAWGVPDSALRYLFYAAAACFPVALIFSWFYDLTSRGIVRTEASDGSESVDLKLKRADFVILAALLGIGLVIVFGSASKIQQEIATEPATAVDAEWVENSIAVLPFKNLDTNPDTGYFSDGVTEEILYRLSSLGALHVLASNSSFAFRDSGESPAQIRAKLGVRYLLQGSIRRENDYVRIMARLIDEGGFQVWSESFDRKLEGVFAIQTEIASTVASQIINEIVPMQELPAGRTTTNMEAYNEYLVGKTLLDSRPGKWQGPAAAAFRKAIELDSGFAPPYAGLAMAITVNSGWGPQWEEGGQLANRALELDPDFAGGHAALALISYAEGNILQIEGRMEQSALSSRRALELNPSLGFAYNLLALALRKLGQADEAVAVMEKGLSVDPLNVPIVGNLAWEASNAGDFDRAIHLLQRLTNLSQPPYIALRYLFGVYGEWGRFSDAIATAKQFTRLFGSPHDTRGFIELAWIYGDLGMTGEADYWKNLVFEYRQDELENLDFTYNLLRTRNADSELGEELRQLVKNTEFREGEHGPWMLAQFGLVNIQLGNFDEGSEQLEYGLRLWQGNADGTGPAESLVIKAFRGDPNDHIFVIHLLAFAWQQVGRSDDANALLRQLADAYDMENNALHLALTGDTAGALQALKSKMENGSAVYYGPGKYYEIINSPAWAETIKAPEFQEFLAGVKEEVDRQRAIVEAIDAEHDFRAEMEKILSK